MGRFSRIRNSAILLKLAACAVWLGLPASASAHQPDATTNSTATDSRLVPAEYNPADIQSGPHISNNEQHIAQWLPPPPRPPRGPPAVASVRG